MTAKTIILWSGLVATIAVSGWGYMAYSKNDFSEYEKKQINGELKEVKWNIDYDPDSVNRLIKMTNIKEECLKNKCLSK